MRQPLVFAAMLVLLVQVCGGAAVAVEAPGADAEQHLAEIESIYAEAVASKQIRLAPADGHPSLLLSDLPRHVEAVRRSLQQLATEPEVSAGPSPAVIAWYEAHRLRAIPPLVADAKAPCEGLTYQPGDPFCAVLESDVRVRLADAIDGLISTLPAVPRDRRSLGSVPPHELTISAALREAVLIFEVAAHADDRTTREWSLYPASPLDDE